jgi:pimeloyl-ACP methyl ester carboxylesterase
MPTVTANGVELHYVEVGTGPQTIVFIHGLMLASESYAAQRETFRTTHRVITFDLRGQGRSEKTRDGLDLDTLAADTAALIKQLVGGPCHVVGFSMGSFIAMRLAARHPELVRSLTLIGPSADAEEPENQPRYARLIRFVRWFGPTLLAPRMMKILFGDTYLQSPAAAAERARWLAYLKALPRSLHRAAAASAGRKAMTDELAKITAPTLVVSGEEDRPISPARAHAVHQGIANSQFLSFPSTGHAVMIERAEAFNTRLRQFLAQVSAPTEHPVSSTETCVL